MEVNLEKRVGEMINRLKGKSNKKGKIITLEGIDGSGKATQAQLLVKRLQESGYNVETLDFPQYDSFFGRHVGKFLRGEYGSLEDVHPEVASFLFAFDRFHQRERIEKWLSEGNIVVFNRYTESSLAHQGAKILDRNKRMEMMEWIYELEKEQLKIPQSDIVIYLHVPPEISTNLVKSKEKRSYLKGKERDIQEEAFDYQRQCVETYLELCSRYDNWHRIDCTENGEIHSREEIHEKLWGIVKEQISQE